MLTNVRVNIKVGIREGAWMMENMMTSRGIPKAQEVEPIKNVKDIAKIKQFLLGKENKRDYMLFVVGINVGLRAGDLLSLKIKDVSTDTVRIIEEKTCKVREFLLNRNAREAIQLYLKSLPTYSEEDYLFQSHKTKKSITVEAVHTILKKTLRELNIKGNFGTHTLRKTFAYHTYANNVRTNPTILETLQRMLNHSSSSVTLRYIGITKEVINDVYSNLNL